MGKPQKTPKGLSKYQEEQSLSRSFDQKNYTI